MNDCSEVNLVYFVISGFFLDYEIVLKGVCDLYIGYNEEEICI